jgi:hypothetical protein
MAKQQTHVPVVRQWCLSLAVLSAVSISRQEAEMKLAAYVPMLLDRFPDATFTTASLQHVASRAVKGFPTYGELAAWLAEWWRDNRPAPPALPPPDLPPDRPPPTPEEVAHVERLVQEMTGFLRSSEQPVADRRPPGARHLTPEQLDAVNPLPNGRKRTHATHPAPPPAELSPIWTADAGEPDAA